MARKALGQGYAGHQQSPKDFKGRMCGLPFRDGEPMTTAQIATAIDYIPERAEKALERMEEAGQVLRNEGLWTTSLTRMNGRLVRTGHGKSREPPDA